MSYYEFFGISRYASDDEIKKAYKRMAKKHHPDKEGGITAIMQKVNEAYDILSDGAKKKEYDLRLDEREKPTDPVARTPSPSAPMQREKPADPVSQTPNPSMPMQKVKKDNRTKTAKVIIASIILIVSGFIGFFVILQPPDNPIEDLPVVHRAPTQFNNQRQPRTNYNTESAGGINTQLKSLGAIIDFDKEIIGFSFEFTSKAIGSMDIQDWSWTDVQEIGYKIYIFDQSRREWISVYSFTIDSLNYSESAIIYLPNRQFRNISILRDDTNNTTLDNIASSSTVTQRWKVYDVVVP
jgi:hypothetical protein